MKIFKLSNKGLLLAILCLLFNSLLSQETLKSKSFFALSVEPSLYEPLTINQVEGENLFEKTINIGGSFNLLYVKNVTNKLQFGLGLGYEFIPHGNNFSIEDSMNVEFIDLIEQSINLGREHRNYNDGLYGIGHNYKEYAQNSINLNCFLQLLHLTN